MVVEIIAILIATLCLMCQLSWPVLCHVSPQIVVGICHVGAHFAGGDKEEALDHPGPHLTRSKAFILSTELHPAIIAFSLR